MSCRHDLANGTCTRCYPDNPFKRAPRDRIDPGPEEDYEPNLEGPGAVPKLTKYEVTITRTIEHKATVEVEAVSLEAAKVLGYEKACEADARWVEGDMVDETTKAQVSRG
jgi:hypothetical protein